jgi:hypothetical protein
MSSQPGGTLDRWRARWQATKFSKWDRQWSLLDARLVMLTVLNALLYWPWHWLRVSFDAGDHHPMLVLGMMILTFWMWSELAKAVINRFNAVSHHPPSKGPGRS